MYDVLNKPCVFIRYNPDAFKIKSKTKRTSKSIRHKKLLEKINFWFNNKPNSVIRDFLFYDIN